MRAVPDLDRNGDAEHRRDEHEQHEPRHAGVRRGEVEEPMGAELRADGLTDQFEQDRGRHEDHLPVEREPADEPPERQVQLREEER
jgi:hypothetical protein